MALIPATEPKSLHFLFQHPRESEGNTFSLPTSDCWPHQRIYMARGSLRIRAVTFGEESPHQARYWLACNYVDKLLGCNSLRPSSPTPK